MLSVVGGYIERIRKCRHSIAHIDIASSRLTCGFALAFERAMEDNSPISFSPWRRLYLPRRRKQEDGKEWQNEKTEGRENLPKWHWTNVIRIVLDSRTILSNHIEQCSELSYQTISFIPGLIYKRMILSIAFWSAFDMQFELDYDN